MPTAPSDHWNPVPSTLSIKKVQRLLYSEASALTSSTFGVPPRLDNKQLVKAHTCVCVWFVRNSQILTETNLLSIHSAAITFAANIYALVASQTNPSINCLATVRIKKTDRFRRPCILTIPFTPFEWKSAFRFSASDSLGELFSLQPNLSIEIGCKPIGW